MILAGDIGGTNSRLAFFDPKLALVAEHIFASRNHTGLEPVIDAFVQEAGLRPEKVCIGIAGPVKNGICKTTNLPWVVDSKKIAAQLGLPTAWLLNDLEANAYGLSALGRQDCLLLHPGAPDASGNRVIVAAGTGLGEAGLFWDGRRHRPFACEGGHSGFAPRNEVELELLRWLFTEHEYPDTEHVLSGPGIHSIYRFLRDSGREKELPWLAEEMLHHDPSACISRAAMDGSCPLSIRTMEIFVDVFGTEAANLALKVMAGGGVYLGGGIAPKILPKLQDGRFLKAFLTTGSMRRILEAMPVRVILNDRTALLGAAVFASQQTGGRS